MRHVRNCECIVWGVLSALLFRCSCTHISRCCEALGVILGGPDAFDICSVTWYRRGSAVPTAMPSIESTTKARWRRTGA